MSKNQRHYSYGPDTGEDQDGFWVNMDGNKDKRRVRWYDTEEEAKAECDRLNGVVVNAGGQ